VSANRAANDSGLSESQIGQAIVEHCTLSSDQVREIATLSRQEGLNFIDAAIRLGAVTQDDVVDAIAWTQRGESRGRPSLIETALSKSISR